MYAPTDDRYICLLAFQDKFVRMFIIHVYTVFAPKKERFFEKVFVAYI